MVPEGTLVVPSTTEAELSGSHATEQLRDRKLIIDLENVTLISREERTRCSNLMRDGAMFSCRDVLTKHALKRLARECRYTP